MAFPTTTETQTSLQNEIPLIWGQRLNDFYKYKLVCADFFVDRSDEVTNGARSLYTPALTEFSANAKSNAATVTLNAPTDAKTCSRVSQKGYCATVKGTNVPPTIKARLNEAVKCTAS